MENKPNEDQKEFLDTLEDDLHKAVDSADEQKVEEIVDSMSNQETLRQASKMSADDRDQMVSLISPQTAADMLEEAPSGLAVTMLENLDSGVAAKIMAELHSDTQADIVKEINKESGDAILLAMEPESAKEVRKLSEYEEDTAGGLMELGAFSFYDSDTVGAVLRRLASKEDQFDRYRGQHPYILDENDKLVGVASLRGLLRSKRSIKLAEIMHPAMSVKPETSQDDLSIMFDDNPFLGIPVTDEQGYLLGVVSRIELAEAELERSEQQSLARQRTGDELRSMPTLLRSRRRLSWLTSNIVLNIIAASIISSYEETLTAVIAIAIFLPMVSDMSGCSGNQAVGVSMRELSLGITRPIDIFHVLRKELGVGIINGFILGVLIGIVAWVWKDNAYLGLVIGLALSLNTLIAVSIGGTVPLILKHFGIDPAVASGPLLTTVTDMAGFFLVLSLATFFMPQLIA